MKRLLGRKKKMKKKGDGMMISMTPPGVLIQGKRYRSLSLSLRISIDTHETTGPL